MSNPLTAKRHRAAWLFLTPALLFITVFFALPVGAGLLLSLTDFDIYAIGSPSVARFVGLENYRWLMHNETFWTAVGNTLKFALIGGPLSIAVSLAAALLLNA